MTVEQLQAAATELVGAVVTDANMFVALDCDMVGDAKYRVTVDTFKGCYEVIYDPDHPDRSTVTPCERPTNPEPIPALQRLASL